MNQNNNFAGVMRQIFALLLAKVPAEIDGQDAFQLVHGDVVMLRGRLERIYNDQFLEGKNAAEKVITEGLAAEKSAADVAKALAVAIQLPAFVSLAQLAVGVRGLIEQSKTALDVQAMSDAELIELGRKVQA